MRQLVYSVILVITIAMFGCTNSHVIDKWANGRITQQRFFTKDSVLYKVINYDSLGNKEHEFYLDKTGEIEKEAEFTSGKIARETFWGNLNIDTVYVTSGSDSGYVKAIAHPDFFEKNYHSNGVIESTGFVRYGRKDSLYHHYDSKGYLKTIEHFKADSLLYTEHF